MNNIIKRVWNQNRMVNIEDLSGAAFQAEDGGHTFAISGVDDTGAAVALSGTVTGVFRRPDNADIALTGSASDGVVSVTLTNDCYAVPGRFGLVIYVTSDSQKTAVYACVGTVAQTNGGAVAGSTPQDVVDLINAISAAVATIPADYSGLLATIAPAYSNTALYSVGSYAWYSGHLYRCILAITTAETWTASHWQAVDLSEDLANNRRSVETDLKSVLLTRSNLEHNGITFTWEGERCHFTGTASGASVCNVVPPHSTFPDFIKAGTVLRFIYEATSTTVPLSIVWFDANNGATYAAVRTSQFITVPSTAVAWSLRFYIASGVSMGTGGQWVNKLKIIAQNDTDKQLAKNVPVNILNNKLSGLGDNSVTSEGVTYLKSNDCTWSASGSLAANKTSRLNVCYDKVNFPTGFSAGGTYAVMLRLADPTSDYYLRVVTYTSSSDNGTAVLEAFNYNDNGYCLGVFTIPSTATGLAIRGQRMNSGSSAAIISDSLEFFCLDVGSKEGAFLRDAIAAISGNVNAKLLSIGNSFMTGAVWHNNAYDHLVSFENSVYGQIAISMCIPQANVRNELYSSTGLVSAPTSGANGSFMDIITSKNLAPYDYLITLFNSTDISTHALGTVNSTDNDGTLAGAVVHLVNYITSSNGKCKLILLSVPPYSSDPAKSGQNTFTGNWPYGYSIDNLDTVMYQLAKKYHFIYVSWQDNQMSYHYTDYMDILSGSTDVRHANDDTVYRAMGEYAALQVQAVNSPIALGKLI